MRNARFPSGRPSSTRRTETARKQSSGLGWPCSRRLLNLPSIAFLNLPVPSGATMISKRASIQASATCGSEYSWMYNRRNTSPCWLAAALTGPCQQGDFNVGPLSPDTHYDPPSQANKTATRCTCSWAAYNLYSACTACQNEAGFLPWPAYKADCPSDFLSNDTYWPADITISGNNNLPFYAGTNPSTWPDQQFNVQQARNITNQQHPELTGQPPSNDNDSSNTTKSKAPVGAIAGGVVGGVAVLVLAALAFWWLRRKRNAPKGGVQDLDPGYQRHSFSEVLPHKPVLNNSVSYNGSSYPTSTSLHPATPTVYTHNESVHSFSQFGSVSAFTTPHSAPSRYVTSPAPTMQTTFPTVAPEDHIQPFVLGQSHSQSHPVHDPPVSPRKGDRVVFNPTQRVSPPIDRGEESREGYPFSNAADAGGNANGTTQPPAYTQYPAPSEASSHNVAAARRELHGHGHRPYPQEKGNRSQDTTQSSSATSPWTSFGSGEGIMNTSMASSHVPFAMAPAVGEFGQIPGQQQQQQHAAQRMQRRSVIGGPEEHVEVA